MRSALLLGLGRSADTVLRGLKPTATRGDFALYTYNNEASSSRERLRQHYEKVTLLSSVAPFLPARLADSSETGVEVNWDHAMQSVQPALNDLFDRQADRAEFVLVAQLAPSDDCHQQTSYLRQRRDHHLALRVLQGKLLEIGSNSQRHFPSVAVSQKTEPRLGDERCRVVVECGCSEATSLREHFVQAMAGRTEFRLHGPMPLFSSELVHLLIQKDIAA